MSEQLEIFSQIKVGEIKEKINKEAEKSYRNAKGYLLPWEEPEYLAQLTNTP